jgi:hypothetical protein
VLIPLLLPVPEGNQISGLSKAVSASATAPLDEIEVTCDNEPSF